MRYRSEAGTEFTSEVEPWAVVVRHGRWYLLCRTGPQQAVRAYRVDRVSEVEPLDEAFERPADLDAVAMLEHHLAVGWEYAVEVLVRPRSSGSGATSPPRSAGSTRSSRTSRAARGSRG